MQDDLEFFRQSSGSTQVCSSSGHREAFLKRGITTAALNLEGTVPIDNDLLTM